MNQPKWAFLKDYVKGFNKNTSITEIARAAISDYELDTYTVEQVRKIISREVNREEVKPLSGIVKSNSYNTALNTNLPKTTLSSYNKPNLIKPKSFTTTGTYLVLGCVHVPGHNKSLINGITNYLIDHKVQGLMLIGDFLDLNSLSGHDIGQFTALPDLTLGKEYEEGNKILDQLTNSLKPSADKVYIYGNHEGRYNRYMADMQKSKATIESPEKALKLEEKGFHVYNNWQQDYITLGNHLDLLHGQFFNVHSAKKHIDVYRGSVMYAHTHRIQMYVEGSTGGFNIGWGGDVNSPLFNYMPRGTKSQWQNGFALVTIDDKGDYYVQQVFHHNNKFNINGKFYN